MSYWERLLAHRHWFTIHAFGREIHLCARCSGIVTGFMAFEVLITLLTGLTSFLVPLYIGFPIALLLALPSILDWTSQSLSFRQSNNRLRFFTGFFEGVGVCFLNTTDASLLMRTEILMSVGLGVLGVTYLTQRTMNKNLKPLQKNC